MYDERALGYHPHSDDGGGRWCEGRDRQWKS